MDFFNPLSDAVYPGKDVSYTGSAANSSAWPVGPEGVLIWASTDCYVAVGEGAVATSSSKCIPKDTLVPFKVPSGTGAPWRVSAIHVATNGVLHAKPLLGR